MSVNKVFLLGNLGADPELRYTPTQLPVCTMRIATSDSRKNQEGERVETTEWHRVVVWGKQAETCKQYLSKGRQVFIEGRIQTKKWQDQQGIDRYTTEIVASDVRFVGGRGETGVATQSAPDDAFDSPVVGGSTSTGLESNFPPPRGKAVNAPVSLEDDDIPF